MNARQYYKFSDNLQEARTIKILLNERREWLKKYREYVKNLSITRKNEGRILFNDIYLRTNEYKFLPKKDYLVVAERYNWAIANLVPPDKRLELISNTPNRVIILTRAKNKYDAAFNVGRYFSPKTTNSINRMMGCLLIPHVLKEYPVYTIGGRIEDVVPTDWSIASNKHKDFVLIKLTKPKKINIESKYKWKNNPKENTINYFDTNRKALIEAEKKFVPKKLRSWNKITNNYPEFNKDKLLVLHNIENNKIIKIRESAYYYDDSVHFDSSKWKRGYPKFVKHKVTNSNKVTIPDQVLNKPL